MANTFDFRRFVIHNLIRPNGYTRLAEIGCYKGKLSRALWSLPNSDVVLVDPYVVNGLDFHRNGMHFLAEKQTHPHWTQKDADALHDALIWDMPPNAVLLRETSLRASKRIKPASLDFVFIDAIHLYEDVKQDIKAWLPKIRKGGMIAGDDWSRRFPGVEQAVRECLPSPLHEQRVWWQICV